MTSARQRSALTLVVEPNPGGHRFQAVADVARLAGQNGAVALLTSTGARDRQEFAVHLADVPVEVYENFERFEPDGSEMAAAVAAFCTAHRTDTVVIMDGDVALKTWWFSAARAFRTVRPRPRVLYFLTRYPARLELSDVAHWRIRIAKGVLILLAMATKTIQRAAGFAGREEKHRGWLVKRARDPAHCHAHSDDRSAIRAELGLPADRPLVGIFGGINARKDPPMVLDAVLHAGLPADLLLAGPVDEQMRAWLDDLDEGLRARVIVADGLLPDELLDKYLAASDVVALLMSLEGPSGIQGKAAAAGVPIVTAGSRTRERELNASGSGIATERELAAIGDALRRVLANEDGCADARPGLPLPTHESFAATILGVRQRCAD